MSGQGRHKASLCALLAQHKILTRLYPIQISLFLFLEGNPFTSQFKNVSKIILLAAFLLTLCVCVCVSNYPPTQVLHPLQQRFLNLINQENFAQISQEEAVKREIVATLEALCGIAEATQIDNVASLFSFLMDFLSSCIGLMEVGARQRRIRLNPVQTCVEPPIHHSIIFHF